MTLKIKRLNGIWWQQLSKTLSQALGLIVLLTSCETAKISKTRNLELEKVSYSDVPQWDHDAHHEALPAIQKSCRVILNHPSTKQVGPNKAAKDWAPFCKESLTISDKGDIKKLMQKHLSPYKIKLSGENDQGTFTGYYYPMLRGAYRRYGRYQYPLYRMPPAHLKKRSRAAIMKGALAKKGLELVYVDSPIDSFFLEIQGSGLIQLDSGEVLRVGYAGQNGYPYYAIGKTVKEKGGDGSSLQGIKKWLKENPSQAQEVMNLNTSYVFFKKNQQTGAVGAQGVVLTPKRSLAVDMFYYSLGLPVWLDASAPLKTSSKSFRKLLVTQDTGGAIKGPIRGDVFFGSGADAETLAGQMISKGSLYIFMPK
ncbi:MAG TPA: MltA domain-containing protein [Alphaproteobacteria bacterium]|nr:MltA domain-containing protein [Alphaproteobacteria bacterium]